MADPVTAESDNVEFTTCLCGQRFQWTDPEAAAPHHGHTRPRWVALRKGMVWPTEWGPFHLVVGSRWTSTGACGANLYRASRRDTRVVDEKPTERICARCARLPERPWEVTTPPETSNHG